MGSTPGTSTTDSMMSAATTTDPSLQTAEAAMKPPAETPAPVNNPGDAGYTKTKSHNMLFVVVAIVSIVAVSLVVLFFYQQYRALSQPEEVNAKPTRLMPTRKPQVSPTVTPASQEERELQNIQLEDVDKEITDIEKDVKGL
jgi:cytochrome c-type biogenesis protein CcmH/NrfG